MRYCPKCLNKSLDIHEKGVVHIIINGKRMERGRFLYKTATQGGNQALFEEKFNEFFQWYSEFQNIEPITSVHLVTKKGYCKYNCKFEPDVMFSVIDILISSKEVSDLLVSMGKRYDIGINLVELR